MQKNRLEEEQQEEREQTVTMTTETEKSVKHERREEQMTVKRTHV